MTCKLFVNSVLTTVQMKNILGTSLNNLLKKNDLFINQNQKSSIYNSNTSLSLAKQNDRNKTTKNRKNKNKQNSFHITSLNDGFGGRPKTFNIPKEDRKKFIFKGNSDNYMDGLKETLDEQDPQENFELEQDLDLYATNEDAYHSKIIEEHRKKSKSIKMGIIQKKLKQLDGENHSYMNLLTWDAKEQIKHLYLNDPKVWTIEKISDSYPITQESCKKLLRSKWSPKTLDDLARHDEKVIQNWNILAAEMNGESRGPALNIYDEYKKSNKIALLKYACGLPDVNFERKALIYSDSFAMHEAVLASPGQFSSIIKRDSKVKELFLKNSEPTGLSEPTEYKSSSDESIIEKHLFTTKKELRKTIAKIMPDEKRTEV